MADLSRPSLSRPSLSRLLRPRSIAFVGGGQVVGAIEACRAGGFEGVLHVVNPMRDEIGGIACVASIADLPEPPDAALVALAPEASIAAVSTLRERGAGGAVVIASGFAETGAAGAALQARLVEAAGDMALIGPNCMGVLNQFDGAAIWGDHSHVARLDGPGAAIVSQSGALLIGMLGVERAFPVGYAISTGNQAATDTAACIRAVLEDERVRVIGLYVEGIADPDAFIAACRAAVEKGVAIVALKGGDEGAGATVALSHTAALALPRDRWSALCRRAGVAQVSSPKALVETLKLIATAGLTRGDRLALVSYSGGMNGLAATRAAELHLALPPPGEAAVAALREALPRGLAIANPFDLNIPFRARSGPSLETPDAVASALATFGDGIADQLVFFIDVPRPDEKGLDAIWSGSLARMDEVARRLAIPCAVAGILPEGLPPAFREKLAGQGVAALSGYDAAMEALAANARLAAMHERLRRAPPAPALLRAGQGAATRMLDEHESKRWLAAHGVVVPDGAVVRSAEEAVQAAARLGFPVALKVLGLAHKTEVGGVRLGLRGDGEVRDAFAEMPEAGACLVERMSVLPNVELLVGVTEDATLGLVMTLGAGGVLAELIADTAALLLPSGEAEIRAALSSLRVARLLDGWRGADPVDIDALVANILCIQNAAVAMAGSLVEMDVNPLLATPYGAVAVDAMIVRRTP